MTMNSVKALNHIINKINEYVEESNGNNYLMVNRVRCLFDTEILLQDSSLDSEV